MTEVKDIYEKYGIDISRLNRDYIKEPLRKIQKNATGFPSLELPVNQRRKFSEIEY